MAPEAEPPDPVDRPIDLSALDPGDWPRAAARVAARAAELRRWRRAVVRRGTAAVALAAAAALALWMSAPRRPAPRARSILDWAVRDASPGEVLGYAQ